MKPAGLVLAALAGLWIAYLVPHWLRHRQQLLESRTDDRFSERLRVIRVARHHTADGSAERSAGRVPQVVLHRGGGGHVDRPHATTDRAVADAARRRAAAHARQAATVARRAARARRRAALAATFLLLTLVGWSAVALTEVTIALGAVPSGFLVGVLVLGRRAAAAGGRATQTSSAAPATVRPRRSAVGRAVRSSEATTEVLERIAGRADPSEVVEEADDALDTATWVPVPVPVPAYTLKPAVRRADPPPLVLDEADAEPAAESTRTAGLDLDAILARRRASGE